MDSGTLNVYCDETFCPLSHHGGCVFQATLNDSTLYFPLFGECISRHVIDTSISECVVAPLPAQPT
jgi:hypothetical protein